METASHKDTTEKKIGILTLPLNINYGGVLQAFALYHTLETLGYQPYLISTQALPKRISIIIRIKILAKRMIRTLLGKPNPVSFDKRISIASTNINCFIRSNIPNVLTPRSFKELELARLDSIVVGSDQVWRPQYAGNIRMFFLNFAESWSIRRIAYAASFGTSEWTFTPEETADCTKLLKKFNAVSVREEDGVRLCREKFDVEAKWVLDPTMLLAPSDYLSTCPEAAGSNSSLVSYILDSDDAKKEIVSALEKSLGTKSEPMMGKLYVGHDASKIVPLMGVEDWLSRLANSSFVFTDSFHGCVFSIIFNKPFIVIINKDRGSSRFDTLLSKFGLTGRIAANADEAVRIAAEAIDWEAVNKKREELRDESLSFLRDSLADRKM